MAHFSVRWEDVILDLGMFDSSHVHRLFEKLYVQLLFDSSHVHRLTIIQFFRYPQQRVLYLNFGEHHVGELLKDPFFF